MLDSIQGLRGNDKQTVIGDAYTGACFVYVVKTDHRLVSLARKYRTTVPTLCEINHISDPENSIMAGSRLLILCRG